MLGMAPAAPFSRPLYNEVEDGGLWIAHKQGTVEREHEGSRIKGFYPDARAKPIIFDARRFLHASGEWNKAESRIVLIAWTVIHARTLHEDLGLELRQVGFPLPSSRDLDRDVPANWVPRGLHENHKKRRLEQTPLRFDNHPCTCKGAR